MSITVKLRRGTTTQHSTFTGEEAEVTVDTTKDVVVVHDGVTAGGHPMVKASALADVAFSGDYGDLINIPAAGSGTVTSVDLSVPIGLAVSGNPITTSGTLALAFSAGYSIPTTTKQSQWDTAYGWGNHASAGYLDTADIGVTVQGYNANTVVDASYVHTDNNYTTTEKNKLAGIAAGAEVNVNADWNSVSGDSQILNKPSLATVATTGAYADLTGKPTLGTAAAAATTDFATAAQGTKADSAVQPAAIANMLETSDIGVTVQGYSAVLAGTTASFTTADETKLDGIAAGAEVNVNADWNAVSGDAQILNKPTLYSDASVDTHLNTSTATSTQVLSWTGTDYDWVDPSGGGSALAVLDEGTTLTSAATSLNFTGAGVTATNTGGAVTVDITGGGGGLTGFTAAESTSAPNDTVFVDSLTASASSTNADVAFVAKGTGATLAQVPDSTAAGGNKRGTHATDWQKARSNSTMVASGNYSIIAGGQSNRASGGWSTVAGGESNTATGTYSFIGSGFSGTASGSHSTVLGGTNGTASNNYASVLGGITNSSSGSSSAVIGGTTNNANASNSVVVGGANGTARSIIGNYVTPASNNPITAASGRTQAAALLLGRQTTDATATVLTSNISAAGTSNQVILPNNSAYTFQGTVIANVTAGGTTSGWKFEGVIKRGATAASTTLVAAVTPTVIAQDAGAAAWVVAVTADTTNGGIAVTVTGAAATTIRWVCKIETTEVTF